METDAQASRTSSKVNALPALANQERHQAAPAATTQYRGRFAPSPTGSLHFGSLVAAIGSYLDAKAHQGLWLVRMEDVDAPRCSQAAADTILRQLEAHGLAWDEKVLYQSTRTAAYQTALDRLVQSGMAYPCGCTRREIADSSRPGIEGSVYPGTCREGLNGKPARAWRVRVDNTPICFDDRRLARQCQSLETDIGDFVVLRADGLFAYQLAVVVDDAEQGVSHIVRGADLLASTPRQIYLQHLLGYATPRYLHLPIALNDAGQKLSKQTQAPALKAQHASHALYRAMQFLGLSPDPALAVAVPAELLAWGIAHWQR